MACNLSLSEVCKNIYLVSNAVIWDLLSVDMFLFYISMFFCTCLKVVCRTSSALMKRTKKK